MNATEDKPKAVRRHTHVAKVTVEVEGKRYRFSLTRKGLMVRQWHSRKTTMLTFAELLKATAPQRQLL